MSEPTHLYECEEAQIFKWAARWGPKGIREAAESALHRRGAKVERPELRPAVFLQLTHAAREVLRAYDRRGGDWCLDEIEDLREVWEEAR